CQHLVKIGATAGHVRSSLPWEGLASTKRLPVLRKKLEDLRGLPPGDEQRNLSATREFCTYLRSAFEKAIEDRILNRVITRGNRSVTPARLADVEVTEEIVRLVNRGI